MKLIVTPDKNFLQVLETNDIEMKQLSISLTKTIKNFNFIKKKYPGWDGTVSFYEKKTGRIPFGLWNEIKQICDLYEYDLELIGMETVIDYDIDKKHFLTWSNDFFAVHEKKPRDYQLKAVLDILYWNRCSLEIATSAGKTFILFMLFAYLKMHNKMKRMLVIVPNISLVTQGIDDFEDYSHDRELMKYKIQGIGGGASKKKREVDIIFGTFQTLRDMPVDFYDDVDVVCVDESHHTKNQSIKQVLSKCRNARIRFGMSGTTGLKYSNSDSYTAMSLLGPLVTKVSAKFLFDKGYATPINVSMIYMDYLDKDIRYALSKLRKKKITYDGAKMYALEKNLVVENEERFDFITKFIAKTKKNCLVLFNNVKDQYGRRIHDRLKDILPNNYEIFYVDGQTKKELRQYYKDKMDDNEDTIKILVASFGTFKQGISINNLHYLFFTESFKSETIILQSCGRGMRLDKGKEIVTVFDFIDDFRTSGYENYIIKHAKERERLYKNESFKIKKREVHF